MTCKIDRNNKVVIAFAILWRLNQSYLSIGQLIGFLQGGGGSGGGHFLFKVQGDIAQFLLDVTDDFTLSCWSHPKK
jgi:hypothetical protein